MVVSAALSKTPCLAADPALKEWVAAAAEWRPLSGGRSNWLWHVVSEGSDRVVKLFNAQSANPLFPNSAQAEAAALRSLQGTGLAPDLIAEVKTGYGPCVIYRHVAGMQGAVSPAQMARSLARLHRVPPHKGLRRLQSGADAILKQGDRILAACSNPAIVADARPHVMDETPRRLVFLHGDPVPANAIRTAGGACLIDWQCPALGDPVEDLAIYLSPAMQLLYGAGPLSGSAAQEFLTAYGDDAATARLKNLAPALHWRMAAHCLWRLERSGDNGRDAEALDLELAALRSVVQLSR